MINRHALRRLFLSLLVVSLFLWVPVFAQVPVTVSSNAGDESVNSLGWAVTTLNNSGAGAISIENTVGTITLDPALTSLPALTYSVTFQGTGSGVIGQNETQSQFLFQQGFTLDTGASLTFTNNGGLSSGLDSALTAASWTLLSNSSFSITGGNGASQSNGGGAFVTLGPASAATGSAFQIQGGAGGAGGTGTGGNGGVAAVTATSLSLSGANGSITGGPAGGGSYVNGNGGSATLSVGSLSMDTGAQLSITGGNSNIGTGALGMGGDAVLAANSVSITGTNTQLTINSGSGSNPVPSEPGPADAGNGGLAVLTASSVTVDSNALLSMTGGAGGSVQASSQGIGGTGGGVSVILGTLSLTNQGSMGLTAGAGGQGINGWNGGNAYVTVGSVSEGTGTSLSLVSGTGGGSHSGGTLNYNVGSQTLNSGSTFIAQGGAGGSGAVIGGNGSAINLTAQALTLSSGSLFEVVNGAAGTGTSASGLAGNASVNLYTLEGSGTVSLGGPGQLSLLVNYGDFSGVLEGTESLDIAAINAALTLTGANTYSGGTTITNGKLSVNSDSNLGTGNLTLDGGTLDIMNNFSTSKAISVTSNGSGIMNVAASDAATFNGVISGPGSLQLTGGGDFNFFAVNTYTGPTEVEDNSNLIVGDATHPSAQIQGPVTMDPKATLMGFGSVAGGIVNNGSIQGGLPGQIGTLSVGSYVQGAGATLNAEVSPTQCSLLSVGGTASLSGSVNVTQDAGTYSGIRYRYVLLSASSLTGTFDTAYYSLLPSWTSYLSYGSSAVTFTLLSASMDFLPYASGANQKAVAQALDTSLYTGSDAMFNKLTELYQMGSGQGAALAQLTGDIYTAIPGILVDNLQFEDSLLFQRLSYGPSAGMDPAHAGLVRDILGAEVSGPAGNAGGLAAPGVRGLWVENTDSSGTVNGDSNVGSFTKSNYGFLAGYDHELSKGFTGGLMGGYIHTDVTSQDSSATAGVDGTQFGLYGGGRFGKLGISGLACYTLDHITSNRAITLGSDVTQVAGAFDGGQFQAALRGDYDLGVPSATVKPYVGLQYARFDANGFTETGSNSLALVMPTQSYESIRPFLGLEGSKYFLLDQDLGFLPRLDVSVGEEMSDNAANFKADFNGDPGNPFTVTGITPSATMVGVEAGFKLLFGKQFNLFADYQGHFSGTQNLNTFNGGLNISL